MSIIEDVSTANSDLASADTVVNSKLFRYLIVSCVIDDFVKIRRPDDIVKINRRDIM